MSAGLAPQIRPIIYPDSDGEPKAENTRQFQWIVTIKEGTAAVFAARDDVFVAGDLLWYPVEGEPTIRIAPDTLVVSGRSKGHRGSYRQWEEGALAPQVVWEVLSPGNRFGEMLEKFNFYDRYGVDEYYLYDPDRGRAEGWIRRDGQLREIAEFDGWVSPRMGIRMEMFGEELVLHGPDGRRFLTYQELVRQRDAVEAAVGELRQQNELERKAREQAQQRADQERQRAEQERQRAELAEARARQLAERLKALGESTT